MAKEQALDQVLEMLRGQYREQMNELADDVATGACRSFDEYRFYVGKIEGIVVCERLLLDLDKKLRQDDFDDD